MRHPIESQLEGVAQAYLVRYSEDKMDTYIALTVILLALIGFWLRQNPRARH